MLEKYFSAPKTLKRLRTGPSAPYIDGFASALQENGYSAASAVRYLRAAVHLGHFLDCTGVSFADIGAEISATFRRHLPSCRCPLSNGGTISHHVVFGVKRFHRYLVQFGVCPSAPAPVTEPGEPPLIAGFRHWLEVHRGAAPPTRKQYCRGASELLDALGADPSRWNARQVRALFLRRVGRDGAATTEKRVTSVRAFLRYLIAQDQCTADLGSGRAHAGALAFGISAAGSNLRATRAVGRLCVLKIYAQASSRRWGNERQHPNGEEAFAGT